MQRRLGDRFTLAFGWDEAGQLTGQTLTAEGSAQSAIHRTFAYREDGHLTAITDRHTGHRDFTLDRAGRVTAVRAENWTERYAYDEAGNQTHASWPDKHPGSQARGVRRYAGSRLVSAGRIRYEHDAQGRVVLRQKSRLSRKPDTWRYTWDAEDHLTSVTTPDGTRWRYLYDPLGRRIAKQRLAADGAVAEETRFTWDGTTLTEQTTHVAGSPETLTLTWDHDGQAPLAQTETKSLADAPRRRSTSGSSRSSPTRSAHRPNWSTSTAPSPGGSGPPCGAPRPGTGTRPPTHRCAFPASTTTPRRNCTTTTSVTTTRRQPATSASTLSDWTPHRTPPPMWTTLTR